jgi:glycine dehydrogenase subunit 1
LTNTGDFQSHYIPNTTDEQRKMLSNIGASSVDELFGDIPSKYRNPELKLPDPLSEIEIVKELSALANKNRTLTSGPSFLGAGSYHHFIPAAIKPLMTRGEFLTAYTPYQPEVSQGTLQVIYEFQSLISNLFGMEVANAGMYDGATSLAEGVLMACRVTKRNTVTISATVSPKYLEVISTYCQAQGISIEMFNPEIPETNKKSACMVVQYPNYYGYVENINKIKESAHASGSLLVVAADPTSLGMFKAPGEYDADIATGEGQSLGIPSSYGGPYLGLFTCKKEFIRQMPSRLVGKTVDKNGQSGYVLTLQTREQHIRRERATSNICTNEALYALASTIYLALLGKTGLKQVAELCYQKAHYAANEINKLNNYSLPINTPFFKEFIISCPRSPSNINKILMKDNILGGYDVSEHIDNGMLLCVTEMNTKEDIDQLVKSLSEV